jgi:hypothetical protein
VASKASHAGIIRIGFEGISQPHFVEHPCFNSPIETLLAGRLQIGGLGRATGAEKGSEGRLGGARIWGEARVAGPGELRWRGCKRICKKMPLLHFHRGYIMYCNQIKKSRSSGSSANLSRKARI